MRILFAIVLSAAAATFVELTAPRAHAHEFSVGALTIDHPIVTPTPGGRDVSAGYLSVTNRGAQADRLVSAASPAAARVEIHEMREGAGGVMEMRAVVGGVAIPARGRASLAPGGLHLMLIGLSEPLAAGETIALTLTFARAGSVEVTANVERPPLRPAHADHGAHPH